MPKSYESLGDLVEDSAKKAQAEKVARSQEQNHLTEQRSKCGYDYLSEGALGDYPNE